jgi:hypothetical protein
MNTRSQLTTGAWTAVLSLIASHMSRPFDPARNEYDDNAYHLMKRMDATRGLMNQPPTVVAAANRYAEPLRAKNLKLNQAIDRALSRPRRP